MPIELGIWKLGKKLEKVAFTSIDSESKLQDTLVQDISLLAPGLMLLGREVLTAHGKYIDLLAMDADGCLSVIELKKHRTPREAVAQLLDYASWAQSLSYEDIATIYAEKHAGKEFEKGFAEAFDDNPPDEVNIDLKLILVAAELDSSSERIINYLSSNFGVPINAVFFRYFKEGNDEYITRTWLIDPQEVETKSSVVKAKKGGEPWNGQDYYVSFGEDEQRVWEEARNYGFISAGGGRWYTRTLELLTPGARVFVCIPKVGYVGVGTVVDTVKTIQEFTITINGIAKPILESGLQGHFLGHLAATAEKAECFVRVVWIKTYPNTEAYWEKGMYANQNTVTKLRNKFTLDRLIKHFELEE
jgi:hypothetical protein